MSQNRKQQSISRFFSNKNANVPKPTYSNNHDFQSSLASLRTTEPPRRTARTVTAAVVVPGNQPRRETRANIALDTAKNLKRFESGSVEDENVGVKRRKVDDPATVKFRSRIKNLFSRTAGQTNDEELEHANTEQEFDEGEQHEEGEQGKNGLLAKYAASKKKKLTPLEEQYIGIKRYYKDVVLAVEVGYKFQFYGDDSRIASKELGIYMVPGWKSIEEAGVNTLYTRFASSSVPIERIPIHTKRLVEKGYKVGIVRQTETAALKAVGDNKSGPFERKLTELYTKGTFIDSFNERGGMMDGATSNSSGFILSVCEDMSSNDVGKSTVMGVVAIAPATGQVIYEEFEDGFMRSELETRVLHIQPIEIVIVGEIAKSSSKVLSHVSTSQNLKSRIRIETVQKPTHSEASTLLTQFYGQKLKDSDGIDAEENNALLEKVLTFPVQVQVCLATMIEHMKQYKLQGIFDRATCFEDFKSKAHMTLNANTLTSLEIYRNQTDFTEKGSLFWIMDQTRTRFGQRMLKKWVGHPLIDREKLEIRIEAVEEIKTSKDARLERLCVLMSKLPDLENGLIRIHYGQCSRSELLVVLRAFERISNTFSEPSDMKEFKSELITKHFLALPNMKQEIAKFLTSFNHEAAQRNDKYGFFKDEDQYPELEDHKMAIFGIEHELNEFLKQARIQANKSYLNYSTSNNIDYLIEVRNTEARTVPKTWVKISGTKNVSRFHAPEVIKLLRERDACREGLAIACDAEYRSFLKKVSEKYEQLREIVQAVAILDCLLSLAAVSMQPNYTRPKFVDKPCLNVRQGRHPMVEHLLLDSYVPNDINIDRDKMRAMVITGPNMGGKSSYVRQTALIAIMGQIGCYVPAEAATLGILDAIFTRMGAYDNMMAGESTFMVELHECADIIRTATSRSLVILDEIGRGTGPVDGIAIAHAVLSHFITDIKALTLFITHYPVLCSFADRYPARVGNYYMGYMEQEANGVKNVAFLYTVEKGIAHRSYGLNVANLAELPNSILEMAAEKSKELEDQMTTLQSINW
ncbi:muts domain V-domain-containing protein [Lipomyces japonicus]|uniref:muts domain V-domain-containing protein n=1 Tax=Lipomyces japonicus TaxID=56871 RepID=UPI0034CD21EA